MSAVEFQEHWRTSHADVVGHLPNLRRYTQFHAILRRGDPILDYPGFDACSALSFDTLGDMDDAFSSSEFTGVVQEDERQFVDKTRFRGVIGEWRTEGLHSGPHALTGPVLAILWLLDNGLNAEAFIERRASARAHLPDFDETRVGWLVTDHAAHAGRFAAAADLVEMIDLDGLAPENGSAARVWIDGIPGARALGAHLAELRKVI
jgi:uncharacterized protein (TIGR02118 family)